jgi:hypothetical protein
MTQAPTSRAGFDNPATQEHRARLLREQERTINTRSALTEVLTPSDGGRFAKRGDFTVGKDEVVHYPQLPSNSPWQQEQPPPEEPFGVDIQFVEVCGTTEEAARAAAILEVAASGVSSPGSAEAGSFLSPPAPTVDPSGFTEGSALGPSPAPEWISPLPADAGATDPTLSSSRGSDPSSHSSWEGQQLGPLPSHPANAPERRAASADRDRGSGPLSSIVRRIG